MKRLLLLLLLASPAFAQTQQDRVSARGRSTFDALANTATITISGATPSVANGNVFKTNNGSSTTITNFLGAADSQPIVVICGDTNTTIANNANIVNSGGAGVTCAGLEQAQYYVFDGSTSQWTQVSGATGGGGTDIRPLNNTFTGINNFTADSHFKINPYTDATLYGVRSASIVTTANITGTTATVPVTTFQNGDGVVAYGAGANNPMSTPSSPTVTPSGLAGVMGANVDVPSAAASTTYNYQCAAVDKRRGVTIASASGTTTTGQATLGLQTVAITSFARAGTLVTVTTTGSVAGLASGMTIYIDTTVSDQTFAGFFTVGTVTDSTHFTFSEPYDTASGAAASATGGNVNFWFANKVACPAIAGSVQFYIVYSGGVPIGMTRLGENTLEDFGSTIMANQTFPDWVPAATPVSATNDELVTTVVSGGGTTTLTLAASATNTVSGAIFKFDNGPNLLPAMTAAVAAGTAMYLPANGSYVVNSYTDISSIVTNILQAGSLQLNDTLQLNSHPTWQAWAGGNSGAQFSWNDLRLVLISGARPGVYINSGGGGTYISGIRFADIDNNAALGMLIDGGSGFNFNFEYDQWTTGSSIDDYLSTGFEARGGFNYMFHKCSWVSGFNGTHPLGPYAGTAYFRGPVDLSQTVPFVDMKEIFITHKGFVRDLYNAGAFAQAVFRIQWGYSQGTRSPLLTSIGGNGFGAGGNIDIDSYNQDTSFSPHLVSLGINSFGGATARSIINGSGERFYSGGTGNIFQFFGGLPNTGMNVGYSTLLGSFTNNIVSTSAAGEFISIFPVPAAPTVVPVSGAGLPAGTYSIQLTWADANNNESSLGAATPVTTAGGNLAIQITPPAAPLGAVGYYAYLNGIKLGIGSGNCPINALGSVFTDTLGFQNPCGQNFPIGLGGVSSLTKAGVAGSQISVEGQTGFKADIKGTFTANRLPTLPDNSGPIAETNFPQTWTAAQVINSFSGTATSLTANSFTQSGETQTTLTHPVFNANVPGALTFPLTNASWTLDKPITLTRVQIQTRVAPSGCSTNAVIRLTDGITNTDTTITANANDSGVIANNYAAGAAISVSVLTAALGCTVYPGDAAVVAQYKAQ